MLQLSMINQLVSSLIYFLGKILHLGFYKIHCRESCTALLVLTRVARLAFSTPNLRNLAFFKQVWQQNFGLAFGLFFAFFLPK